MSELFFAAIGVFFLGITTTVHPCPFATNIAAISLISGVSSGRKGSLHVLVGFNLGYLAAFILLAVLVNFSLIAIPNLSRILQQGIATLLGPILILVGMVLVRLINLDHLYHALALHKNNWLTRGSFAASFLLGTILALTFCPATAAIFFGVLVPLSVSHDQIVLFPVFYALGALFPIMAISVFVLRGLASTLRQSWLTQIPKLAGWIMILVGIYITLDRIYL